MIHFPEDDDLTYEAEEKMMEVEMDAEFDAWLATVDSGESEDSELMTMDLDYDDYYGEEDFG